MKPTLWLLWHVAFYPWQIFALLPICLALPYIAQRRQNTWVAIIIHSEIQGRVMTLLLSMAAAAAPLSLLVARPVVDAPGAPFWFILGGLLTLLVGSAGFFIPALLHIEAQRAAPASLATPSD